MLPRLDIPDWRPPVDGEAALWEEEDTPREPREVRPAGSLPASPSARKTKSRAARSYVRTNSLRDTKVRRYGLTYPLRDGANNSADSTVLVVSDMHRTESALDPALFQYHQHFESPWQLIGKTSLSEVFRVRHRASGEVFAVKRSRRRFRSKLQRERCLREIRAVAALPTHPNIVNQYRAWQEGGHFYIQMDFCEGGSLAQWAHKACTHGQCLTDNQVWSTACQAAQGLAFLHSHRILHLDIKPDNIYLTGGAGTGPGAAAGWTTCRIGDFGLAVAREQDGSMDWEEGDGCYVAPELLAAGGEPSPAADVFSLGATLYECATGRRLPRSEGWSQAHVAALQVEGRPPAFVQLLRAMLQPSPALRPTAEQVVEAVTREQPAVAAAAQEAVDTAAAAARVEEAAAEAALAARQAAVAAAQRQAPSLLQAASAASSPDFSLQTSPFMVRASAPAAPEASSPQAADAEQFSFDVPLQQCPPTGGKAFAFTPGQPLRPHNKRGSSGGPPGSAVKARGTPLAGRSRMGARWAPALSPLISEGALTPGAAAALAGLTPATHRGSVDGAPTPLWARDAGGSDGQGPSSGDGGGVTPLDIWRPAPLQVPPHTAAAGLSSGAAMGSGGRTSGGTQDSRDSWRLQRRDILSPDSDFLNAGSHSESEYSYSCGTGRTTSDMDFADALSPMSADLGLFGAGRTPSTGTPESLQRASCTPSSMPSHQQQQQPSPQPTPSPLQDQGQQAQAGGMAAAALPGHLGRLAQAAPSLAWDLHTSPEFLMQLPPGSPDSLSRSSSLEDAASLPSRGLSVRRFPTLDSWGSQLDGAGSVPMATRDSMALLAAQRFTNTFAVRQPSGGDGAAAPAAQGGADGASAPLPVGGRALRKRQHSSRRTLMAALSRDHSGASSMEGMAPLGKARHIMHSCSSSPRAEAAEAGQQPLHPLHRSASALGRDAAAALADGASAKAAAAGALGSPHRGPAAEAEEPRSEWLAAATPSHHLLRDISFGPGAVGAAAAAAAAAGQKVPAVPPPSPLHARMTGLKLRSTD